LLSALVEARGKVLWQGICNLLPAGEKNYAQLVYDHPLIDGLSLSDRPSYIPPRTFALALLDVIGGDENGKVDANALTSKIAALPAALGKPLNILWAEANGDIEKFKANIEIWFNHSMDRVSGFYKRRLQFILLAIAMVVAVALNADSVVLITKISHDSALRARLVAGADAQVASGAPAAQPPPTPGQTSLAQQQQNLATAIGNVEGLRIPIGWVSGSTDPDFRFPDSHDGFVAGCFSIWDVVKHHFVGWLVTGLDISLGAPFWFDMRTRVVNTRSAGQAPAEAAEKKKTRDGKSPS
jgi:hypothetical protein